MCSWGPASPEQLCWCPSVWQRSSLLTVSLCNDRFVCSKLVGCWTNWAWTIEVWATDAWSKGGNAAVAPGKWMLLSGSTEGWKEDAELKVSVSGGTIEASWGTVRSMSSLWPRKSLLGGSPRGFWEGMRFIFVAASAAGGCGKMTI